MEIDVFSYKGRDIPHAVVVAGPHLQYVFVVGVENSFLQVFTK
jgi:hypothetical protein